MLSGHCVQTVCMVGVMSEIHLIVDNPDAAAAWYAEALGARETSRVVLPGGQTLTVELRIAEPGPTARPGGGEPGDIGPDDTGPGAGGTVIAVAAEIPGTPMRTPASLGGTPAAFHLRVADADAAWQRAIGAGATEFQPLHDAFWGERTGQFLDPSGHRWALDQHIRDVPAEEIARKAAELFGARP